MLNFCFEHNVDSSSSPPSFLPLPILPLPPFLPSRPVIWTLFCLFWTLFWGNFGGLFEGKLGGMFEGILGGMFERIFGRILGILWSLDIPFLIITPSSSNLILLSSYN
ncbi:hypothetical protein AGABI1DRAFT_135208 [Agaricus bisporus var. burnettii JB137-S8]|uniref:Uncharacterized protein n=1 Tax=Agaricus bisporus var. burnettii (strain JB137-S8 / ATCC MYA-4627 / FGSC 10392) TaxID=597362 RepID=K5VG19_AGABU|nr:uncharacterized protein AGABI1DRAFT_135208 [Agaricus bisporus var. burnettii JB137-S8]EKM73259.1 hypothetical protein AGABI1DRAFT_135208 [Agaricus bisporus var. burnettii JB137-S8]